MNHTQVRFWPYPTNQASASYVFVQNRLSGVSCKSVTMRMSQVAFKLRRLFIILEAAHGNGQSEQPQEKNQT
jgi:hypothetical protein